MGKPMRRWPIRLASLLSLQRKRKRLHSRRNAVQSKTATTRHSRRKRSHHQHKHRSLNKLTNRYMDTCSPTDAVEFGSCSSDQKSNSPWVKSNPPEGKCWQQGVT